MKFKVEAISSEIIKYSEKSGRMEPQRYVGWVEMDIPETKVQGFRTPIPKKSLKDLKKKIVKRFGKIMSFRVVDMGGEAVAYT